MHGVGDVEGVPKSAAGLKDVVVESLRAAGAWQAPFVNANCAEP